MLLSVALPAHNQHSHTIIFLHGCGSSARELSHRVWETQDSRGLSLQHIFPTVKWVFPQAEEVYVERLQQNSRQWFDIWDARNPDERRELQLSGLKNVVPELVSLIESEAATVGLQNIILAGISQGCAAAIHALLHYPGSEQDGESKRLCAFVGLSGWMSLGGGSVRESRELLQPKVEESAAVASEDVYRGTPVFISHCADNTIVPIKEGERLRDTLTAYGMTVTWKVYPNGGYWINGPQGVEDLVAFLNSQGLASE
ncbi:phospholipase/carboxylesterase family protein [Nemania sp. NC0429]|nr:phospholipase/carboxylesterase family protein [Nemania sp. NC0429]